MRTLPLQGLGEFAELPESGIRGDRESEAFEFMVICFRVLIPITSRVD